MLGFSGDVRWLVLPASAPEGIVDPGVGRCVTLDWAEQATITTTSRSAEDRRFHGSLLAMSVTAYREHLRHALR